ncbi:Tetratricopeptide repeat protein [compost metagenome]
MKPDTEIPGALLGEIYFATGHWGKAKQALELSVQLNPTYENQYNLGSALFQMGQISEAAQYYWCAHEAKGETYTYLSLYNYVSCQMQLGCYPVQEIAELEQALDNPHSEVEQESLAEIYYAADQFTKVVDAYEDCKLWLSPSWVLPYYYTLMQCRLTEKAAELKDKVFKRIAELIRECEQDDDEDYTWEDRQSSLREFEADKVKYQEGFEKIESAAYRPEFIFEPQIESKCYLFGCRRHGNANYTD